MSGVWRNWPSGRFDECSSLSYTINRPCVYNVRYRNEYNPGYNREAPMTYKITRDYLWSEEVDLENVAKQKMELKELLTRCDQLRHSKSHLVKLIRQQEGRLGYIHDELELVRDHRLERHIMPECMMIELQEDAARYRKFITNILSDSINDTQKLSIVSNFTCTDLINQQVNNIEKLFEVLIALRCRVLELGNKADDTVVYSIYNKCNVLLDDIAAAPERADTINIALRLSAIQRDVEQVAGVRPTSCTEPQVDTEPNTSTPAPTPPQSNETHSSPSTADEVPTLAPYESDEAPGEFGRAPSPAAYESYEAPYDPHRAPSPAAYESCEASYESDRSEHSPADDSPVFVESFGADQSIPSPEHPAVPSEPAEIHLDTVSMSMSITDTSCYASQPREDAAVENCVPTDGDQSMENCDESESIDEELPKNKYNLRNRSMHQQESIPKTPPTRNTRTSKKTTTPPTINTRTPKKTTTPSTRNTRTPNKTTTPPTRNTRTPKKTTAGIRSTSATQKAAEREMEERLRKGVLNAKREMKRRSAKVEKEKEDKVEITSVVVAKKPRVIDTIDLSSDDENDNMHTGVADVVTMKNTVATGESATMRDTDNNDVIVLPEQATSSLADNFEKVDFFACPPLSCSTPITSPRTKKRLSRLPNPRRFTADPELLFRDERGLSPVTGRGPRARYAIMMQRSRRFIKEFHPEDSSIMCLDIPIK